MTSRGDRLKAMGNEKGKHISKAMQGAQHIHIWEVAIATLVKTCKQLRCLPQMTGKRSHDCVAKLPVISGINRPCPESSLPPVFIWSAS